MFADLDRAASLIYRKRTLIQAPERQFGMHPTPQANHKHLWTPYPSRVGAIPAQLAHTVHSYATLNVATFEHDSWFFKDGKVLENMSFLEVRDAANEIYDRLQDWKANLHDSLKEENNKTPHSLSLQYVAICHFGQYLRLH